MTKELLSQENYSNDGYCHTKLTISYYEEIKTNKIIYTVYVKKITKRITHHYNERISGVIGPEIKKEDIFEYFVESKLSKDQLEDMIYSSINKRNRWKKFID